MVFGAVVPAVAGADRSGLRRGPQDAQAAARPGSARSSARSAQGSFTSLLREKYLRELSPLERSLESLPAMDALAEMIEQAGPVDSRAPPGPAGRRCSPSRGAAGAWTFTRNPLLALLAAAVGAAPAVPQDLARPHAAPREVRGAAARCRRRDEARAAAGHPFSAAIKLVAEDMDEPIGGVRHDLRRHQLRQRRAPRDARPAAARAERDRHGGRDGRARAEGNRRQPGRDPRPDQHA